MTDPRRLGSEDPQAAALFAAARTYRPPARARRRLLRALGVPVGLSLLTSALAHAAQVLAPFKGWIIAGTIAAASAGGGVAYLSQRPAAPRTLAVTESPPAARRTRPHAARPVPEVSAPAPVAVVEPVPAEPVAVAPAPPAVRPSPPRTSARASRILRQVAQADLPPPAPPPVPAVPSVAVVPEPPPAPASAVAIAPAPLPSTSFTQLVPPPAPAPRVLPRSTLDLELALIEKARGELEHASPRRALVTLDEYARSFPGGALLEESELLRLAALKASGAQLEAVAAAQAFLLAHPRSPLAARARTFLPVDSSK